MIEEGIEHKIVATNIIFRGKILKFPPKYYQIHGNFTHEEMKSIYFWNLYPISKESMR